MPILDYGDIGAPAGRYYAKFLVGAVMGWPNDEIFRKQYLATDLAKNIGYLEREEADFPESRHGETPDETARAIDQRKELKATLAQVRDWFAEAGGLFAVAEAPGQEYFNQWFNKCYFQWLGTGFVLGLVRRMALHHPELRGGASVNKAKHIVEAVGIPGVPRNSCDVSLAWTTYKPVAHFCAAIFDTTMEVAQIEADPQIGIAIISKKIADDIVQFLSDAEAYLMFGLTYSSPRAMAKTVLDPDKTWTLPKHGPWPPAPDIPRLNDELLRIARNYKAPIRGA